MEVDPYSILLKFLDICIFFVGCSCSVIIAVEPNFDVPVVNVTVVEGRNAILPCTVQYLGDNHKVIWTDGVSTLLTFDGKRIIDDDRISVERPVVKDWNLMIREVKYTDKGEYICQINTKPIKTKTVILNVLVPPSINEDLSSADVVANEGDNVQLMCNVTGVPQPSVHWYRQVYSHKNNDIIKERVGSNGDILIIHNVSRYCDGVYECVASNGVATEVKKEIHVQVEFKPEIKLQTKRIGQYQGKDTILECDITAVPQALSVWKRHGQTLVTDDVKYRIEIYNSNHNDYRITLSLAIIDIGSEDYGAYTCFAQNKLGKDREDMILYESFQSTVAASTTLREYESQTHRWGLENSEKDKPIIVLEQGKNTKSIIETVIVTKGANSAVFAGNKNNTADSGGWIKRVFCTSSLIPICRTEKTGGPGWNCAQTSSKLNSSLFIFITVYEIIRTFFNLNIHLHHT